MSHILDDDDDTSFPIVNYLFTYKPDILGTLMEKLRHESFKIMSPALRCVGAITSTNQYPIIDSFLNSGLLDCAA